MSCILGIDPGAATGCAIYRAGKLVHLQTIEPHEIDAFISALAPDRVVLEDSRLQSHVWIAEPKLSRTEAMARARSVGQVDAWCKLIAAVCERQGIPAHSISPKAKGKKAKPEDFVATTGWAGRSNEHTRDAAMVAHPYRGAGHRLLRSAA